MARLVRSFGLLASAAGLAFVIRTLVTEWPEVGPSVRGADARWLVAALVLGAAGMTYAASGWGLVLRLLGWPIGLVHATALYFRGEIAKYVPGGMWAVVGRGELARREGMQATIAYSSVLLSLGALYVSCAVVAGALVPWSETIEGAPAAAVVAVVVLGLAGLHPTVLAVVRSIARRLLKRDLEVEIPSWSASLRLVAFYAPVWLCVGTATWSIVHSLHIEAGWAPVVLATATSWLVGFLAVPVPGGIGIREAVFLAALPSLDLGPASAAAVVSRVLFMLVDALGAALGWFVRPARARVGSAP